MIRFKYQEHFYRVNESSKGKSEVVNVFFKKIGVEYRCGQLRSIFNRLMG